MDPVVVIAQALSWYEQPIIVIWILIGLVALLAIAVFILAFRIVLHREALLTDYQETQIYSLTKRALVKAIEEYENGKSNNSTKVASTVETKKESVKEAMAKLEAKTDDEPGKLKVKVSRVPYSKR